MTDEELREQVRQTLAKHRAGYTGYVYATDDALADALIPLVAKAQREADVAALEANAASRRYGGQIPQWAADYLCSLPLISEEGATRG